MSDFLPEEVNDLLTGPGRTGDSFCTDVSHQLDPLLSLSWLTPADLEVGTSGLAANCLTNLRTYGV